MKTFTIIGMLLLPFLTFSCQKNEAPPDYFLRVSQNTLTFGDYSETKELNVETNLPEIAPEVPTSAQEWCTARLNGSKLTITVDGNKASNMRTTSVTLKGAGSDITARVAVLQQPFNPAVGALPDDIKIPVSSGVASENHPGEGIELSFDGNLNTHYHSRWSGKTEFPVILTYNFDNVSSMDYVVYYPRVNGTNGNFRKLEVWAKESGGVLKKRGDYDFNGTAGRVVFDPPLVNPTQVEFKVLSGMADALGSYACCAEMEFYRKHPAMFDYLTIFTDSSCSELKPGITAEAIQAIPNEFFRDLAHRIFTGIYDAEFRVQEYRAWEHPDIKAALNKTAAYSLRDNPTGIYVKAGEELIVFVGEMHGQSVSLVSQDLSTGGWGTRHNYPLARGLNKLKTKANGLLYVEYYSPLAETAPKIKINFATGLVNGYFDVQKHQTTDWQRLLEKAVADDFDLVGEFAHLTFPTGIFKANTPNGKALVEKYDELVRLEHEFMGLYKYPERRFKNRMYFHADYNPKAAYMYATSYRTGYSMGTIAGIVTLNTFSTTAVWGPAHEVGHVNQVRPILKWTGMGEVTNNIYSMHVQTAFGNRSRLLDDGRYETAFNNVVGKNIPHNDISDVFIQLIPFWQLKLYMHDVLGQTDFWPDLINRCMSETGPTTPDTEGRYQLHFVRMACETAQLNLLEFFTAWGFLTPIDKSINDYNTAWFTVTQEEIDALKAEIEAKGFPKPAKDFSLITDETLGNFK